ncbi:ATP-binding cassette domain-containing protein [Glutamicibacter soli]|uniref:ATP-binding cassette domain-containing protein n=1 Tax=Glutamicibacter soli TaxID=453836 RepID=A0A6L9G7X5_9MICC|nr:ABC transporter ATP-binding protein [Glutamicibacter soli]NAZ16490.1 ATP-binding cassette domain-containing protein [Glutamicibacter soli]
MNAITVENLVKSYGTNLVLDDLALEVPEGSIVSLLGPNGAGKTSLVEILEGHRGRDSGLVSVCGLDPEVRKDFKILRTQMGVVLQQTMLEPGISSRDLLRRQASYYANPIPVHELLGMLDLEEKADAFVRTLSGGMRRRLDIALALIGRPRMLFLDEPTTGLDPLSRRKIRNLVKDVNRQGTTVVLTSHDLEEVQELAQNVHVLAAGRFIAEGTPRELIAQSTAETVIEFLHGSFGIAELPAGAKLVDGVATYRTIDPEPLLAELNAWSQLTGTTLRGLTVVPPSLDDAYVNLIHNPSYSGGI